jgi:hypothetical protein
MMALEHKTTLSVTLKGGDKGEARVRFSTPDGVTVDKDRDVTGPQAFTEGAQVVVSPFGHRSVTDGAIPAGRATIHQNCTASLRFFLDTPTGRETFTVLRELKEITQYSYAFRILEEGELTAAMRAAGARRHLKRLLVTEISPVIEAAGLNTGTLTLKECGCGGGSTCGCEKAEPAPAFTAVLAEASRIFARNAKLAGTAETPPSPRLDWVGELALARAIAEFEQRDAAYKTGCPPQIKEEVPAHLVAGDAMLCEALEAATKDLGIPWLRIRYFAEPASYNGLFNGLFADSIWLRSNRSKWDQLQTLGHELHHAAQHFHGGPPHDEKGARLYGKRLLHSDPRAWVNGEVRPLTYTATGERL